MCGDGGESQGDGGTLREDRDNGSAQDECTPQRFWINSFTEAGSFQLAQDWLDGAVLMVAWMNRESIEDLQSGEVHY